MAKPLTAKQRAFILASPRTMNAAQACRDAGYIGKNLGDVGSRLLKNPQIQAGLSADLEERKARLKFDADYVLTTIRETVERCRQAEPVRDKDGEPTGEYRFDATNVLKGSELLGKHLGMFVDRKRLENPDGSPIGPPSYTFIVNPVKP